MDTATIDRIVAGVLTQLAADGRGVTTETRRHGEGIGNRKMPIAGIGQGRDIDANVITADVLDDLENGDSRIVVSERAIITPAAWDVARERGLDIVRANRGSATQFESVAKPASIKVALPLMIVVRTTDTVERLWNDLQTAWRRELLGCPDDAAALATIALCRGETNKVAILAEQAHRAACVANRNGRVKAVAVGEAGDVRSIKKQLQANVWCLDPAGRSWFELRNLLRAINN